MKKIIIFTYQEGVSGIKYANRYNGIVPIARMVADANAAADALYQNGAEVFVCDFSGCGRDVFNSELTKNAKAVSVAQVAELCRKGVDGAILIGAHAMNSAPEAFGSYTVHPVAWQKYELNGKEYGDIGIVAIFFGAYNVPIIAVSGDLAAVNECKSLVGDIPSAAVKTAKENRIADTIMTEKDAETLIAKTAVDGLKRIAEFKPYTVDEPFTARIEYNRADYCDEAYSRNRNKDGVKRVSALVIEKTNDKITEYCDLVVL